MLSDKYQVKDFVEAVKPMTFAELEKAVAQECADLASGADPLLSRDHLKHMTFAAQKKFTEQRNEIKVGYGRFLQHLRALLKDERALGQFQRHEMVHLLALFRNIALAEHPKCGRYVAVVNAEMELHSKSQLLDRRQVDLDRV